MTANNSGSYMLNAWLYVKDPGNPNGAESWCTAQTTEETWWECLENWIMSRTLLKLQCLWMAFGLMPGATAAMPVVQATIWGP